MAEFGKMVLTHDGIALQGKSQAGADLQFTRVAIGDGYLPDGTDLQDLTDLVHEIESLDITELVNIGAGKVRLQARVTNEGVTEGFYIREIGIFANDPDAGEILYAVANAGDRADYIPEEGGGIIEEILNLITIVGNAEHVTAVIDSSSAATVQQVQELDARVTTLETELSNDPAPIPYHIQRGQNIVDAVQESGISLKSIKGRTDINHVPLFDSGLWNLHANAVMDSPTKITHTNTSGNVEQSQIFIPCVAPKTMSLSLKTSGSPVVSVRSVDVNKAIIVTHFSESVGADVVVTFTSDAAAKFIRIDLASATAGTYTFENVMLAEGSEARPFVANMKPLGAVLIENKGKNLAHSWEQGNYASGNGAPIDTTTTIRSRDISVVPGETYVATSSDDFSSRIFYFGENNTYLGHTTFSNPNVYEVPANVRMIRLSMKRVDETDLLIGDLSQVKPMLNLGTEPMDYELPNPSRIVIPEVGRSSADGTVCDEVYERDGKLYRLQKFGYKVLDGLLNWSIHSDQSGYKILIANDILSGRLSGSAIDAVKYDGRVIKFVSAPNQSGPDEMYTLGGGLNLAVSVADTDSGWSETYTPTVDEIKAYFYGWKMFSATTGNSPYDSGTKAWYPIGNVHGQHSVTSVPLYQAETTRPGRWQPYQLQYQLAQPVEVEIADVGGLSFHTGLNQVELSEGVILRESTIPAQSPSTTMYYLNAYDPYSPLKHRVHAIKAIYRNGREDTHNWTIRTRSDLNSDAYKNAGAQFAEISRVDYDPTAAYSVDYITMDKYLLTTNVDEADLEGQANLATAVGKNVRDIADIKRDVTVIERDFARKQQMKPITPTLINGWVAGSTVEYYVDEFGILRFSGLINSGVVGQPALRIPKQLAPKLRSRSYLCSATGSATSGARVVINTDGELTVIAAPSGDAYLDVITFRAGY